MARWQDKMKNHPIQLILYRFCCPLLATLFTGLAIADPGDPIAVRRVEGGFVVESMWNLSVRIIRSEKFPTTELAGVDLPRTAVPGPPAANRFLQQRSSFDSVLDRQPNEAAPTWSPFPSDQPRSSNAIRVRGGESFVLIELDDVLIAYVDDETDMDKDTQDEISEAQVLIFGKSSTNTSPTSAAWVIRSSDNQEMAAQNTFCISSESQKPETSKTVWLHSDSVVLPRDVETLLVAKEDACQESQAVFAKLSINQMNFRPSNGSHTPRWNTEHMMGRELLFFSQIYHALDNSIPIMDLNPKQMPDDYVAKHADWDGAEEARQMQRVSAFTRRFAYLLIDLPLEKQAPGSRWKLDALLRQMDRHYTEHTANVKKKFALEDWPQK